MRKVEKIDGVNYVRKTVPNVNGTIELEGLTVRALIKALQKCDPDDLVCYMAEVTDELRASELLLGVTAGVLSESSYGVSFIVGPESVTAMENAGWFNGPC